MKTGFFERRPGNKSMMRLLAFLGFILGAVVTLWGMFLFTYAIVQIANGKIDLVASLGSIGLLIGGGMGLAGAGEGLKVLQQRSEAKEDPSVQDGNNNYNGNGSSSGGIDL